MNMKYVPKIWGSELWIINREYCGKILTLNKGKSCSLHYHKQKHETFYILEGKIKLECGNKAIIMKKGDRKIIPKKMKHRFTGIKKSKILEISTHHRDSDSYRI